MARSITPEPDGHTPCNQAGEEYGWPQAGQTHGGQGLLWSTCGHSVGLKMQAAFSRAIHHAFYKGEGDKGTVVVPIAGRGEYGKPGIAGSLGSSASPTFCWGRQDDQQARVRRPSGPALRPLHIPVSESLGGGRETTDHESSCTALQGRSFCRFSPDSVLTRPLRGTRCFSINSPSSGLATGSGASSARSMRTRQSFMLAPDMPW